MRVKAIIFDRDNTLLYFDPVKVQELFARLTAIAPGINFKKLTDYWYKERSGPLPATPQEEPAFWHSFWLHEVPNNLGFPVQQTSKLAAKVGIYHQVFSAFPDAAAALKELSNSYRITVFTNFELPNVRAAFQSAGLDISDIPDADLLSSSMLGLKKPDPAAFTAALNRFGLTPEEVVLIEDDIQNANAARELGIMSLVIDREGKLPAGTEGVIASLQEISTILTRGELRRILPR